MPRAPRLAMMAIPGLDHFTADLLRQLPQASGWEVRKFTVGSTDALAAALAWTDQPVTDALWFEFCWPPFPALIAATDFAGRRVIIRVHRIEATETPHVAHTRWDKVNDVIVVSPDMQRRVLAAAPEISVTSQLHLVLNGVDTNRFVSAIERHPFRIGWCGLLTLRKNPTLALQVLAKLHAADTRYHLSMCGMGGEPFAEETFVHLASRLGLRDAIQWAGRIAQADMPRWHAANSILLHTSLHEGLSYAVLEAAASGCDLAVLDHPGAAECWPASVLYASVDAAAALIIEAQPDRWRGFIHDTFALDRQVAAVSQILNQKDRQNA